MDDPLIYAAFLNDVVGIIAPRVSTEMLTFTNTLRTLLSSTEEELTTVVKNTHSSNSARTANTKILFPAGAVIVL